MKKLLKLLDNNILRFGVAFAILFTALYPKLPSIHIERTWVYIRLEDFLILALAIIWFIQLLRKKVSLPRPVGWALVLYWVMGLISLAYCLAFIAPHLNNFFPKIAVLQYARRIEYMILFFIAFSSVKKIKDVYFYLTTLCVTLLGIVLYGFGQRFYFLLWHAFPAFFHKNPFCFPAFLTGNEEFAKGVPLCLNDTSRITSTFGGHYDLSAYIVFVIPILIALVFVVKRWSLKVLITLLALFALELLNFTSSRTSFAAYVVGVASMLVLWKKKWWIVPILAASVGVMLLFGNSTIQRFSNTVQQVQVVSANQQLPADLQKIIATAKKTEENKKPEVPPASDFTVGGNQASSSGFSAVLTNEQLEMLKNGDISISTVSGSFLVKKAYALDISFTTRFQGEWPRNWNAFMHSPIFGTGYSSLTLATDNDYLRALGETGLVGFLSFFFIFVVLGIFMKETLGSVKDNITKALLFGLAGGVIGLLMNAVLIDVFEASKVAEPLWILLGIGVGAASLYRKQINYKKELFHFFTSHVMIAIYLLVLVLVGYASSLNNFFVANDFTWLHRAANAVNSDVPKYFLTFNETIYQPLSKSVMYLLYSLFSFQPQGYHVFLLFIHIFSVVILYFLVTKLTKDRLVGAVSAGFFAIHPTHAANVMWLSTLSVDLASLFILAAILAYVTFRQNKSVISYILAVLFSLLAFLSHQIALIIPILIVALDLFVIKTKWNVKSIMRYLPWIIIVVAYLLVSPNSLVYLFAAEIWMYLLIAAFVVAFVMLLSLVTRHFVKDKTKAVIIILIVGLLVTGVHLLQNNQQLTKWNKAGAITKNALTFFRFHHQDFSPVSVLYFTNTPLQKDGVPVFQSGLSDGLWFIYRESMPRVYLSDTVEQAQIARTTYPKNSYIFQFINGVLSEIK